MRIQNEEEKEKIVRILRPRHVWHDRFSMFSGNLVNSSPIVFAADSRCTLALYLQLPCVLRAVGANLTQTWGLSILL